MQKFLTSFQQYCVIIHCDVLAVVYEKFIPWVISTKYERKHLINLYTSNILHSMQKLFICYLICKIVMIFFNKQPCRFQIIVKFFCIVICSFSSVNNILTFTIFRGMFHGGDSDSTGVMAGCWYGAMYGFEGVPEGNYKVRLCFQI